MVEGISNGYKIDLELVGVGYRASVSGQILDLSVGYLMVIFDDDDLWIMIFDADF
jgi:large subunit ribosomal protein L6